MFAAHRGSDGAYFVAERSRMVVTWHGAQKSRRSAIGSKTAHHSGKPQQNAYVERYNRTVRHEWLDLYIFESIEEVQQIATEWLWSYNHERPNMGNGGMTPAQKLKMAA